MILFTTVRSTESSSPKHAQKLFHHRPPPSLLTDPDVGFQLVDMSITSPAPGHHMNSWNICLLTSVSIQDPAQYFKSSNAIPKNLMLLACMLIWFTEKRRGEGVSGLDGRNSTVFPSVTVLPSGCLKASIQIFSKHIQWFWTRAQRPALWDGYFSIKKFAAVLLLLQGQLPRLESDR